MDEILSILWYKGLVFINKCIDLVLESAEKKYHVSAAEIHCDGILELFVK
jgi:hypothetical protein